MESKHIIAAINRVKTRMDSLIADQQIIQDSILKGRKVSYKDYKRLVPPINPVFSKYAEIYEKLHMMLDVIDPDRYIIF